MPDPRVIVLRVGVTGKSFRLLARLPRRRPCFYGIRWATGARVYRLQAWQGPPGAAYIVLVERTEDVRITERSLAVVGQEHKAQLLLRGT